MLSTTSYATSRASRLVSLQQLQRCFKQLGVRLPSGLRMDAGAAPLKPLRA
jgi:hypothetical protein